MHFYRKSWFDLFKEQFISLLNFGQNHFVQLRWNLFSVWLPITNAQCIQHSQAMLDCGVCELAHSFFHWWLFMLNVLIRVLTEFPISYSDKWLFICVLTRIPVSCSHTWLFLMVINDTILCWFRVLTGSLWWLRCGTETSSCPRMSWLARGPSPWIESSPPTSSKSQWVVVLVWKDRQIYHKVLCVCHDKDNVCRINWNVILRSKALKGPRLWADMEIFFM